MSNRKRIKLTHGSARVDENCSRATIKALDQLSVLAYEMENEPLNIDDVSKCGMCDEPIKPELFVKGSKNLCGDCIF